MRLGEVRTLLPYQVAWVNEPWNAYLNTPPFPKQRDFFVVSTLWCPLFSILLYWRIRKKFKFENIIVGTVSTNIWTLCGTYFYVNWHTKSKCINIFIVMVTYFKRIHNETVPWPLYFWLAAGTIPPKISKRPMLFLKI